MKDIINDSLLAPSAGNDQPRKYIAGKLPSAKLKCLPKTGHLWVLEHMKEILEVLHKGE